MMNIFISQHPSEKSALRSQSLISPRDTGGAQSEHQSHTFDSPSLDKATKETKTSLMIDEHQQSSNYWICFCISPGSGMKTFCFCRERKLQTEPNADRH